MHKCFARFEPVAGTPRHNDDVGLMQRGLDGRIIEFANLVRQAFIIIRLDIGELIHHNQAAHTVKFRQALLENYPLQKLDRLIGHVFTGITWVLHHRADCFAFWVGIFRGDLKAVAIVWLAFREKLGYYVYAVKVLVNHGARLFMEIATDRVYEEL